MAENANTLDLGKLTLDELWALHEDVSTLLMKQILQQKEELEGRLAILNRGSAPARESGNAIRAPAPKPPRRKYPEVLPRYRNPETSETWSGRGKVPRWMSAALEAGRAMDEFLIGKPIAYSQRKS